MYDVVVRFLGASVLHSRHRTRLGAHLEKDRVSRVLRPGAFTFVVREHGDGRAYLGDAHGRAAWDALWFS